MAVTEAPCSGNGSERVDRNGAATATASRLVTVLEPILEEYAVEACFLSKVKDEADLEVGCREASKGLTLCIRVERLPRLVLDDHLAVDDHIHSLVGKRFTAEVDHYRYFSVDFVPLLDEESFQRAGVDVLAKSEAEFPVDFEEGIDDRRSNLAM